MAKAEKAAASDTAPVSGAAVEVIDFNIRVFFTHRLEANSEAVGRLGDEKLFDIHP